MVSVIIFGKRAITLFSSPRTILACSGVFQRLLTMVLLENLLVALKVMIMVLIDDVPEGVSILDECSALNLNSGHHYTASLLPKLSHSHHNI